METVHAKNVLSEFVEGYETQRDAAKALGISQAYLSDMLNGRRNITDKLLAKLGLKRVVVRK